MIISNTWSVTVGLEARLIGWGKNMQTYTTFFLNTCRNLVTELPFILWAVTTDEETAKRKSRLLLLSRNEITLDSLTADVVFLTSEALFSHKHTHIKILILPYNLHNPECLEFKCDSITSLEPEKALGGCTHTEKCWYVEKKKPSILPFSLGDSLIFMPCNVGCTLK